MPENRSSKKPCVLAVIWIDWYAYHVARFRGLLSAPGLAGQTAGIELVGGVGVHAGLKFRQPLPADLPVDTLLPEGDWQSANKWALAWAVWKKLSALQPQAVLVPGYYTLPAIAAALWARLHRRTSVLMTESASYDHVRVATKEWAKGALLRVLFQWAVAGGKDHVTYLRSLRFPEDRIAGFYDVVDNRMYEEGVSRLRAEASKASATTPDAFLFVGRLSPEKNVQGLLQAWTAYRAKGGTWSLVLAGDGPERTVLQQLAKDSGYESDVVITGLKSSEELLPYFASASCFVLPSTREPWGLVVNEAMASGLPVLVSNRCGCAHDLVHAGLNGFVFDPHVADELTACMQRMEALGAEARSNMGAYSRQVIQAYSPEAFGREVARIVATTSAMGSLDLARQVP
ncbi:glycosyltransferase [Terriglobus sp.]|uniref:glycosyltransferase n=1 Tax=Terriglobus sp. TaxID=1889013 RepID=UPI003B00C758